jgi:tetratricopeptide (TPR) repeat protein
MPLSVAPALSSAAFLQVLAYVGFFLLILLYPIGRDNTKDGERRLLRVILVAILFSGTLVAIIGVVQRFFWNGKILWFFIPEQWESALPDIPPRASGPFVNSDHFANYLTLLIPLLFGGISAHRFFTSHRQGNVFKIFCVLALLMSAIGVLFSLSRGGWIGTGVATGVFLWSLRRIPREQRPLFLRHPSRSQLCGVVLGCSIFIFLLLFLIGSLGRNQIDRRLEETLTATTALSDRMAVWQDSFGMIHDFPLFGVGLGAWSELFPRYQRPPWDPLSWRETHNDYLQCLVETGVVGFGLLVWFFFGVVRRIWQRLRAVGSPHSSFVAGILASFAGMAFHEGFDFSFQIPANALLLTALVALGLRMVNDYDHDQSEKRENRWQVPFAVSAGILAVILGGVAIAQKKVVYQNDPDDFTSIAEARENILAFPARSDGHVALISLLEDNVPLTERIKEFEIALWLTPLNPEIRDQYVVALLEQEQQDAALKAVRQSVFNSPTLATHFYLTPEAIPLLDLPEVEVIEQGLQQALTAKYPGAVDGLAGFYQQLGRLTQQGDVYVQAARTESRRDKQVRYLREAGVAYAHAGVRQEAESLLRQVIELTPHDPIPYRILATDVLAAKGDIAGAKQLINEGITNGATAIPLLLSLADAAQKVGDWEQAKAILQEVIARQSSLFDAHFRLGKLYLREKNFADAASAFQQAAVLRPDSAPAFFFLGQTEEGRLRLSEAQKAYTQALALAPHDTTLQHRYQTLRQKLTLETKSARNPISELQPARSGEKTRPFSPG